MRITWRLSLGMRISVAAILQCWDPSWPTRLNFSGVTEEWTSGGTGTAPATLIAPPDPWTQALDNVQFALDIAGMVPVVGEAADLINVGIHAGRGNWTDAAISGAAAVPFLGMFATGGKFLKKAASKVDDVGGLVASKSDDLAEEVVRLCFPEGVLVDTESGHKRIETVEAGERVWAYDVVTSEWRLCRVLQTFEKDYEGDSVFVTVDGEMIESTFRHPYWVVRGENLSDRPLLDHHVAVPENATTAGRWVDAGDLQAGDILLLRDGRQVPVTSISTKHVVQKVYNFEVEGLHNYAVGKSGILVHNNNGDEAANTSGFSMPAYVGAGKNPVPAGSPTKNVEELINAIDDLPQKIKGTISQNKETAKQLAKDVAKKNGVSDSRRGPEIHNDGMPHYHIEDFAGWHFWF